MATAKVTTVAITPPKIEKLAIKIRGTSPLVMHRFSQKAMQQMMAKMEGGSTSKGKKVREARNFQEDFENAKHISTEGWCGFPASAFRAGLISCCRLVNFKMTLAKMSIFVEADGLDKVDQVPLIRIEGEPEPNTMSVRLETGVADVRVRPLWKNWTATVRISYDADQFSASDIVNLMARMGTQCGIGEGRVNSRESAGLGWGCFEIVS